MRPIQESPHLKVITKSLSLGIKPRMRKLMSKKKKLRKMKTKVRTKKMIRPRNQKIKIYPRRKKTSHRLEILKAMIVHRRVEELAIVGVVA